MGYQMIKCTVCKLDVPEDVVRGCWADPITPDHIGVCCDCFDASFGMRPRVKLEGDTATRVAEDDDEELTKIW